MNYFNNINIILIIKLSNKFLTNNLFIPILFKNINLISIYLNI